MCRLIAHTISQKLQIEAEHLRSHRFKIRCELTANITRYRYATMIRFLCVKITAPSPKDDMELSVHGWIQQILTSGEHPPEQSRNDSRLVKDQIDLNLIKCWLQTCKEQHNSTHLQTKFFNASFEHPTPTNILDRSALICQPCEPTPVNTKASNLTLVDVKRGCLVDMPFNTTYIALSYVWGGHQRFQNIASTRKKLYTPHSVSMDNEAISLTIRDAILLVARLGEQYIWVDSLCICQDEMEHKLNQIMNMRNIYSQALFTIIAASGKNADAGIPGLQEFSRSSAQRTECVQGMVLANEFPYIDMVENSYWNTRGWTYQEKELCNRYLIFCRTQVFFRCNRNVFKEDSGMRDIAFRGKRAKKILGEKRPIWNSYRRAVAEYTERTLSDESDMINAFQGVAKLLQPAFKGDFIFGLPETELDLALLWQPTSLIRRRVNPETQVPLFPSWSWAGWVGKVDYLWTRHLPDDLSRVEWYCTDLDDGNKRFCSSNQLRAPKYGDHDHWENVQISESLH